MDILAPQLITFHRRAREHSTYRVSMEWLDERGTAVTEKLINCCSLDAKVVVINAIKELGSLVIGIIGCQNCGS